MKLYILYSIAVPPPRSKQVCAVAPQEVAPQLTNDAGEMEKVKKSLFPIVYIQLQVQVYCNSMMRVQIEHAAMACMHAAWGCYSTIMH